MVSSGTVNGDLASVTSVFSQYDSVLSGLTGSWKGPSYDNFQSKTSEFSSSYLSTIKSQMTAFASACDLYEQYKSAKTALSTAQSNYNNATSSSDKSKYNLEITDCKTKMENLSSQIQSQLSAASSEVLEASSFSGATGLSNRDWTSDDNFVYYNQSGGWNNYRYNNNNGANTMGASGCGPVAMSMVLSSLGYDINPNEAADWSSDHGYHPSTGTDPGYFNAYASELGVPHEKIEVSSSSISSALKNGDLVILNVEPGDFTNYGHYIVARGYDASTNQVLIADPNHTSNNTWWDLDRVTNQTKNSWAFNAAAV